MNFLSAAKWSWLPFCLCMAAAQADPSAIWKIENDKCVPHMRESHDPSPCAVVDLDMGYVILKDREGATQFLLMPTARISGIESPAILAQNAPNY
jgi:CDP-diacylglycerol pyrophosphatase